jgi:hypothetical protein
MTTTAAAATTKTTTTTMMMMMMMMMMMIAESGPSRPRQQRHRLSRDALRFCRNSFGLAA